MFGLGWLDLLLIVGMVVSLIGMKVCSKQQRTMKNAQLYAVLLLCVVFVCTGWLLWRQFLWDLVVDKSELAMRRTEAQWAGQGYGVGKYINGPLKNDEDFKGRDKGDGILVIYDDNGTPNSKRTVDAFKRGLEEAGINLSNVEFKQLEISASAPMMGPAGPGMGVTMLMTYADFLKAMKGQDQPVVISLLGLPNSMSQNVADLTNRGKRAFVVAGNVYQNQMQVMAVGNKLVTALLQMKPDAPGYEDSYPEEAPAAFDAFYQIVTPKNAQQVYQQMQKASSSK